LQDGTSLALWTILEKKWSRTRRSILLLLAAPSALRPRPWLRAAMPFGPQDHRPGLDDGADLGPHGYLVYDTLFSLDEKLVVRPQMVDSGRSSPDKLTYTFTLRMAWSGTTATPVTGGRLRRLEQRWARAIETRPGPCMSFIRPT